MERLSSLKFPSRKASWSGCIVGALLSVCSPAAALAAATSAQVDKALANVKQFLYAEEKNGNWERVAHRDPAGERFSVDAGQFGGMTSLVVYALLAAGEDPANPKLAEAIKWIKQADVIGTYALGMRCQCWLLLPSTPETRKLAAADLEKLWGGYMTTRVPGQYLYSYVSTKRELDQTDHSVSQFGVLATWACEQMGVEVPTKYWQNEELRWRFDQKPDGGWLYGNKPNTTDHAHEQVSMTAAGVATLFITQEFNHRDDGTRCSGNIKDEHIDRGLAWIASHTAEWTTGEDFGGFELAGYNLYGIERIGVASGLKYFGNVNWYEYGADWCVKNQWGNGSWSNIPNSALCTLFLVRGRAPVLINKVQYENATGSSTDREGRWNQRPRDVANFVHWMTKQTERDINWQVTNLDVPEEELHDAPFLYFAGNKPIDLKPEQAEKVKQFILHGGMVLFNSDCGEGELNPFVASVIKLGKQFFPDYEFRDIPAAHPIFTSEQYPPTKWKRKLQFKGLSNGVREMMILMPGDPGKTFQTQETGAGHEEAYQAMDDLILYGTDKQNLLQKGQSFLIARDPVVVASKTVKVARLQYNRNWDPEPGGWERLAAVMHNQAKVDINVTPVLLGGTPLAAYKVAHLTGTNSFTFTVDQQQQLKNYVEGGGTLVIDCAGHSGEFAQSAEAMLTKVFPGNALTTMSSKDDIFKVGVPKSELRYRHFAKANLGSVRTPLIKAIDIKGRHAVYYSHEDISGGLVGQPIDGIVGYEPDTCTEIMSGIIIQAAK